MITPYFLSKVFLIYIFSINIIAKTKKGGFTLMNIIVFRRLVKSRKECKLYESKPLGSAIKFKRKAMKMTLEEGSEGICSVSYLSKIENNLIELGDQFLDPLVERFGLENLYDSQDNNFEKDMEEIIEHLTYNTKPERDMLFEYVDRIDYQAQLIQMGYNIIFGYDEIAWQSFNDLKMYIPNLEDQEFTLFLILSSIYLYRHNQHSEAFEILILAPKFEDLKQRSVLLLLKWRLLNAFRMHKMSEVFTNYPIYVNMLVDIEHFNLLQDIRNEYIQFEAYYRHPENIEDSLSKMHTLSKKEKDYVLAKSLFFHRRYQEVIRLGRSYYKNSSQWLILYLISLDNEHKHNDLKLLLTQTNDLKDTCNTSQLLISHLQHKYSGDKEQLLNYLRRTILGIKNLTDEYHILDYLMVDSQQLFSSLQLYKEAVQVTKSYLPRLKTLKQAESNPDKE